MMEGKGKKRAKVVWQFARPYKWSFFNALFCIFMTSVISMFYPYVFGLLVDEVFYNKNMNFFLIIVAGYAFLYLSEQLLHLILNILWPYQFTVFLLDVRAAVYKKIISLPYEQLSNTSLGEMITRINHDTEGFVELIHRNISYLLSNSLRILMTIVFVGIINVKLAILMVIVVPISYTVSYKLGKRIGKKQKEVRESYGGFIGWIFEILGGMRDIKLMGAKNTVSEKCMEYSVDISRKTITSSKLEVLSERVCSAVSLLSDLSLYILASIFIVSGEISLGGFVAAIAYFETANNLLKATNGYWNKIHTNFVVIDKVIEILDRESEDMEEIKELTVQEGIIHFDNVSFSYNDDVNVLNHLELIIPAGEKVAIVGKSGAGKSTIANLLLRFLEPSNGAVKVDGCNIRECRISSVRDNIGIVQQEIFVFDGSIRSNLLLANAKATDKEIIEACENAALGDYIKGLSDGLDTVIGSKGIAMSGGERQRLAVARLFLRNPKILIFDEATSSLDFESETQINHVWDNLREGRTSIIIAHRLSTVLTADKIAVLSDGVIVDYAKHNELLKRCREYQVLFEEQYMSQEKLQQEG